MIINPIIPIWLMTIICISLIVLVVYNKHSKEKNKKYRQRMRLNIIIKILIIIILFIINLRFMLPNGETTVLNADVNVLFVIDTSVSMRALDYNGNKERLEGVVTDCCNIIDELSNCKFSVITFGDTVQKLIPFTSDTTMVQAELKAINLENDFYATGTSINMVKDLLEKTLQKDQEKRGENSKCILFFITDGEITKENETMDSFSSISPYIFDGAIMGYGTVSGGKMVNSLYEDENSKYHYLYYYDNNYIMQTAISKIDENNLKQLSKDINIDYIQMSKTSNINYKLKDIKDKINNSMTNEDKITSYSDIYYLFAIPLVFLFIADFVLIKIKM